MSSEVTVEGVARWNISATTLVGAAAAGGWRRAAPEETSLEKAPGGHEDGDDSGHRPQQRLEHLVLQLLSPRIEILTSLKDVN